MTTLHRRTPGRALRGSTLVAAAAILALVTTFAQRGRRSPGLQGLRARRQIRAADDRSPCRKALQDRDQQRRQGPDGIREQGLEAGEGARRRREVVGGDQRVSSRARTPSSTNITWTPPRARSSRSRVESVARDFTMGNALFIIWRESAEAMLVVGILYAWLAQAAGREAGNALPVGRCRRRSRTGARAGRRHARHREDAFRRGARVLPARDDADRLRAHRADGVLDAPPRPHVQARSRGEHGNPMPRPRTGGGFPSSSRWR